MFKINDKYTKTTTVTSFWCLYSLLWSYYPPFSIVSNVDFGQVMFADG